MSGLLRRTLLVWTAERPRPLADHDASRAVAEEAGKDDGNEASNNGQQPSPIWHVRERRATRKASAAARRR